MQHSPGFLALAEAARQRIEEITAAEVKALLDEAAAFHLIDVREDHERSVDFLPGSEHSSRGVLERDIEMRIPDKAAPIVLYCGGGYRSALAADSLQRMGYTKIRSMAGGIRGWREAGYPVEKG